MSREYEPLHIEVQKMKGNKEGVKAIFDAILKTLPDTKNDSYILKLDLKEVSTVKS